ncbi:hypothetical protein PAHAL_3G087200 [Panicum hallii]|uniref:At1g61320/AtMIF1 LRR domain-containing protein n=2 Tax=Panicum hallii TaxID=206008 RepID=A0A2T8KHP6_9POAL|nr:hypothetical protein PAHAL_3G087200 [Panicum hallii]
MASYTEATMRLLAPTSERAVRLLRLAFFLCADLSCLRSIGHAVATAAAGSGRSEPSAVDLTLWTEPRRSRCIEEHAALYGRRFASFLAACPSAFGCLTGLTLRSLKLADPEVRDILSTCARLRELCLKYCGQPTTVAERLVLRIDAPSSRLVTLRIVGCFFSGIELVCVPRLARLVVETWLGDDDPPLRFGHVPWLHHIRFASALLSYQEPFALSNWLANTTSISVLDLDFKGEMVWIQLEDAKFLAPIFSNLKELHLQEIFPGCDLKWTLLYLEAAPFLNSLYAKISRHICGLNRLQCIAEKTNLLREARDFKHHSLNYVEIQGFQPEQTLISYTRLVMGRAVNLKRIRLRCKDECERCDRVRERAGAPMRSAWSEEEKNLVRAQIVHGFSPSSIELIMDDMDLVCIDNWFLVEI